MNLTDKRPTFRRVKSRSNPYRILLWVGLILVAYMVYRGVDQGAIKRPFDPTSTPTRTILSFEQEGDTFFQIGNLEAAIQAYKDATQNNPDSAELWIKLARIQTYSSISLTTDDEILKRRQEALASIDKAIQLAPERSDAYAVRAFVLDWLASSSLVMANEEQSKQYLNDGEAAATRALQLDEQNVQAMAYKAEILVDQQKWLQAQQTIDQALPRGADDMDVHRINAYVLSSVQEYLPSIEEYKRASELAPKLTFLYIEIGKIYRYLATSGDAAQSKQRFNEAFDYFTKAVDINNQLGLRDPIPYLAIAKTYMQRGDGGDFLVAVRNVKKALQLNPGSSDVYAQLGLTYHRARNYEGAIDAFKCALEGCTPQESCKVRGDCQDATRQLTIAGLPLTGNTQVYYYTYGSVLAALSKPTNSNCEAAARIFAKLRQAYGSDAFVMSFVNSGEAICAYVPEPTGTPVKSATSAKPIQQRVTSTP
ncbi:MAG: tetratricopeptide repeat protein [Anaerolineaceae bacterium]|nr:tetratricopeptide repeat protein [Anaerolineaceae bacterium]